MKQEMIDHAPLEVKDLKKSYGKTRALRNLSFTLRPGSCVGLLGPNGAGKTTACHLVSGLLAPDSGEIKIHGLSFGGDRKKILENIGIQLQESRFYEKATVRETFELFSSFYPKSLSIETLLDKLDLREKENKRLSDLSGGQKQRVYLGCALIHDPQLLIFDEPMTGLDPSSQKQTREFILKLKEEGKTILLCTHNMNDAKRLCDDILILDRGELVCQGSSDELIREMCGEDILSFSLEDKKGYEKLRNSLSWIPKNADQKLEFGTSDGLDKAKELSEVASSLGLKLKELSVRPANLEDVFFKATGRNFHD